MDQNQREDAFGDDGERHLLAGRYQEALASFQAALEMARQRGDSAAESVWLGNCGAAHLALRGFPQAHQRFAEAAKLAHEARPARARDAVASLGCDQPLRAAAA